MRARTSSATGRIKLLGHLRPGQIVPEIPRNAEPRTGMSMGEHQAITTERFGIAREEQDELAVASHQGLAAAYERGFFDDLVTPYLGLERDQNLRPDSSTDKLAKLKPVFGDTMTAGQLDAAVGRRRGRAALERRAGRSSAASPCSRTSPHARPRRSTTSTATTAC